MKALIICPADRQAVAALARQHPLALWPFLGKPILDHAMTFLASKGAKEIRVLAADRPDEIRTFARRGEAWGVAIEVLPEARELTRDEARAKYQSTGSAGWLPAPLDIITLDALPQLPGCPLWESYAGWQSVLLAWLAAGAREKVGMRELSPGVYIGRRVRIAPSAKLNPPCWIGEHAWVGPGAVVGPDTVLEDHVYVDQSAGIVHSVIGPRTYVGVLTEVRDSLAWGRNLLNLKTGSHTEVSDHFLLGELGLRTRSGTSSPPGRLAALLAMIFTSPLLFVAWWRNRRSGQPLFVRQIAARSGSLKAMPVGDTIDYYELGGFTGWTRRWPQLWNIVRGNFRWVGNRPLAPSQATQLQSEFELLWLAAPTGLFSLADTLGCPDEFSDDTRSHSSFYAVDPGKRKEWRILWRVFCAVFGCRPA
jgi:hypothetical protein